MPATVLAVLLPIVVAAVSLLHRGEHVARAWQQLKDLVADLIATGAQASRASPKHLRC